MLLAVVGIEYRQMYHEFHVHDENDGDETTLLMRVLLLLMILYYSHSTYNLSFNDYNWCLCVVLVLTEELTVDRVYSQNSRNALFRQALSQPWNPTDMTHVPFALTEPSAEYFEVRQSVSCLL